MFYQISINITIVFKKIDLLSNKFSQLKILFFSINLWANQQK